MKVKTVFYLLCALFAFGIFTEKACSQAPDSIIRIVQISDTQLGFTFARSKETGVTNATPDSITKEIDARYYQEAVNAINSLEPKADAVINTGDLVNDPADREQWNQYLEISRQFEAPVYETMGNHDGWSTEGIAAFRERFHHHDFYSFVIKDCSFIVLNSWYLKDPENNPEESEMQMQFLINILKNDQNSRFRIILMHFPIYVNSPDEEDAYFNLPLEQRSKLLDICLKNKVPLVLSGHSHRNIMNTYKDSVTLITTGPVSEPLGLNSDKTPSERGFRIIDINLKTGTFTHEFIRLTEPGRQVTVREADDNKLSFVFLGDTHFDRPEHHDMDWVLKTHPGDTSQIRQYCRKTNHILPALYGDIETLISSNNAELVVQTGDFTEGLCGDYSLATKQLTDFIDFTHQYIKVPYLLSKGNHDITGPGADSAYRNTILPFLSRQAGELIQNSNYVLVKDRAVFFFYDSYDAASLNWLGNAMQKYEDMPFKFVIMHEPVVPINARSKWTELSSPAEKKERDRLLELLGRNRAIVLAGHLHCFGLVIRKTRHGEFTQLSVSSVPENLKQDPAKRISGKNSYGESLMDLEPDFSPSDRNERMKILKKEKRRINYFEYADLQGYIMITMNNDQIMADIYSGTGLNKWKTVDLTGLISEAH